MIMIIRMVLGFIMGVQMSDKLGVAALPQNMDHPLGSSVGDETFLMAKRRGFDSMSGLTFGKEKKNFDEIDRSGFGAFVKRFPGPSKKNFDEIDRAGFGAFVKRFPSKRNFDEIDRAGFGAFVK